MRAAVLIPVYNAFDEALECLKSVAHHSPGVQVLVLDDASPEGNFVDHVPESLFQELELEIVRNETNLGFPANCNRGFELLSPADVVILNSDTVVTKQWLEKLHQAAVSDAKVGTVTPLTNNGDLCSVPLFRANNSIPTGYSLESFAELVERVSSREYPQMPTCTGHCVYLKRELLDKTGGFDVETFGKGYGEENDLSCRARSFGFVDILDDATFIFHKGECSFTEQSIELRKQNFQALEKKHRDYSARIATYIARNPLSSVQRKIQHQLALDAIEKTNGLVVHVLHNGPFRSYGDPLGGTERHVRDLIKNLPQFFHCSLVAAQDFLWFTFHHPDFDYQFCLANQKGVLSELLSNLSFAHIHLHHSRWFAHAELLRLLATLPSYTVSIHDYVLGCPRFHLLTPKGSLCNRHECVASCAIGHEYIEQYRQASLLALENASCCVAFSQSSVELLRDMLPGNWNADVVPHGSTIRNKAKLTRNQSKDIETVIRVLILGSITYHKGGDLLRNLFKHKRLFQGSLIQWHVLGDAQFKSPASHVVSHGKYSAEDLSGRISDIAPHLALFLSRAPETYSLSVDEALDCGVPVLVSPRGAPAERVARDGVGWVVPELSEGVVLDMLNKIQRDVHGYNSVIKAVESHRTPELCGEIEFYRELYSKEIAEPKLELSALFHTLIVNQQPEFLSGSGPMKVVGDAVNRSLVLLDSLGVRRRIQSTVERFAPESLVSRLKKARRDAFLK